MRTITVYSSKTLKKIDRKLIKVINGIEFDPVYPKLEIEGKKVLYQEPTNHCPVYIEPPFVVTL
jgi:hypothetical protein